VKNEIKHRWQAGALLSVLMSMAFQSPQYSLSAQPAAAAEKQVTRGPGGRILTNIGVWSPDSQWIVYDTRSDAPGESFDGTRIEMVHVETGEVRVLYESARGAHCGVVTFHPRKNKVAFILGPENPTPDWRYSVSHRQGVVVRVDAPRQGVNLDARDLTAPFTPGALRGGTHVHVWDPQGDWLSFTYNDALLESDLRDVGISVPGRPVQVKKEHPRNHDGTSFSVLVTRTTPSPVPGSDEIQRACEEGWIGTNGYMRADGSQQQRALAFQGNVKTTRGQIVTEVYLVDLPDDLTLPGDGPLAGSERQRPCPPRGVSQRRLTRTADRKFPGLQGPRHWLRSSPDGARIAFLMRDDEGIVQLWTISPQGGPPVQLTRNPWPIASAFSWSPDGRYLAHALDGSVAITEAASGKSTRLTARASEREAPRPEVCVFSPDQRRIAYVRRLLRDGNESNQIFVVDVPR
jgi:hypothetical protein